MVVIYNNPNGSLSFKTCLIIIDYITNCNSFFTIKLFIHNRLKKYQIVISILFNLFRDSCLMSVVKYPNLNPDKWYSDMTHIPKLWFTAKVKQTNISLTKHMQIKPQTFSKWVPLSVVSRPVLLSSQWQTWRTDDPRLKSQLVSLFRMLL